METLFDELRAAREARGITLEDVARQTLINVRFLKALDAGDTSILPQTYVRAFLRAYASCVGMDPAYAMQRLDGMPSRTAAPQAPQLPGAASAQTPPSGERAIPPPPPPPAPISASVEPPAPTPAPAPTQVPAPASTPDPVTPPASAPPPVPDQAPVAGEAAPPGLPPVDLQIPALDVSTSAIPAVSEEVPPFWSKPWVRSAGTTLVVLVGIAIIAYFARRPGTPPQEIPFGTVLQENAVRLAPKDTTRGTLMPQGVSPRDSLVLRASTTDSVWVQIARDALPPTEHLFPPGASRTWKARDRFLLSLGNAGGISFRLNNRDLGKLGKPGAVLRNVEMTRENLTSPVRTEVQP